MCFILCGLYFTCTLFLFFAEIVCECHIGIAEFAGMENNGPENDGVEQEQTYILHTKKNFSVYDM